MKRKLTALTLALGFSLATAAFAQDTQDKMATEKPSQDKMATDQKMDTMSDAKMAKGKMHHKKKKKGSTDSMKSTMSDDKMAH
jgi:hypothetical protein